MPRLTGIRDCRAAAESTVDNCIEGDFEYPSLFRHSSKDALTNLCLKKPSTGTVEKEGPARSESPKIFPPVASNVYLCRILSPVAAFAKEDGGGKKSGIDQIVLTLLRAKRETNIAED